MRHSLSVFVGLLTLVATAAPAAAGSITCAGTNRAFSLADATACTQGVSANPDAALIDSQGGVWTGIWQKEGELSGSGTNDLFTITVANGTFGAGDVSGSWTIQPAFWNTWARAVISAHVGEGGGDPDWWLFLVDPGDLTGTWAYDLNTGTGGGLSNLKLWGTGMGTGVPSQQLLSTPEPATLILLGAGLVGVGIQVRRRGRTAG